MKGNYVLTIFNRLLLEKEIIFIYIETYIIYKYIYIIYKTLKAFLQLSN